MYTVVDILTDEDVIPERDEDFISEQGDAHGIASDLWEALKLRQHCTNENSPFDITATRIERKQEWDKYPAYSFCLLLSMGVWSKVKPAWRNLGGGFTAEGELFEKLTEASLIRHFPDWEFRVIGWSRSNTTGLADTIKNIGQNLRERELASYIDYLDPRSKDAGLDLIGYRTFKDTRGALPIFFLQCATGDNWDDKLDTPNLDIWGKIIDFTSKPKRGFAMPFSLLESDKSRIFRQSAVKVGGPFLDRYRLLSVTTGNQELESWVPLDLKTQLIDWVAPRLPYLRWDS